MKILKTINARAIWLFPVPDMNPQGKAMAADLLVWLKNTYQFLKYPSSPLDLDKESNTLSFSGGKYKFSGYDIAVGLSVYNDGLIANTEASTTASEAFLREILSAVTKEFGLVDPGEIRKKLYLSEMDVQLDKSISLLNPRLELLAQQVRNLRPEDPNVNFTFSGIGFFPEPDAQSKLSPVSLERKVGTDWAENRYYTKAPLQTEAHIKLLEEIESLLVE